MWQLSTHGDLRSLGLGAAHIKEAEARIKKRGVDTALLGVEDDNPRARSLYERLGYVGYGHENESWEGKSLAWA